MILFALLFIIPCQAALDDFYSLALTNADCNIRISTFDECLSLSSTGFSSLSTGQLVTSTSSPTGCVFHNNGWKYNSAVSGQQCSSTYKCVCIKDYACQAPTVASIRNGVRGCYGKLAAVLTTGNPNACTPANGQLDIWINSALQMNEIYEIQQANIEANSANIAGNIQCQQLTTSSKITTAGGMDISGGVNINTGTLEIKESAGGLQVDSFLDTTNKISIQTQGRVNIVGRTDQTPGIWLSRPTGENPYFLGASETNVDNVGVWSRYASGGAKWVVTINKEGHITAPNFIGTASAATLSSNTWGARPRTLHYASAPTDGGIAPKDIANGRMQFAMTNWNVHGTGGGYADTLLLSAWGDSSGGHENIIKFSKRARTIRFEQGSFDSTSRMSSYKDVTMTSGSDRRLKKKIQTIEDPLTKITQLRGVNFEWREKYVTSLSNETSEMVFNDAYDEGLQMGFIAQEVEKVIPEVVERGHIGYEGLDDVLALDYPKITALLVEGIKELNQKVEELTKKVEELSKN